MLGLETEEEARGEVFQVVDAHLIFQILGWSIISNCHCLCICVMLPFLNSY